MKNEKEDEVNTRLKGFIEQRKAEYREQEAGHRRWMKESEKRDAEAKRFLSGKLVPAKIKDYKRWLAGFMREGGTPTYYHDYPMTRVIKEFFVATQDFEIAPLYGSSSINIIVPKGVNFKGGELGHSQLYFMDGFRRGGSGCIPIYSDITTL